MKKKKENKFLKYLKNLNKKEKYLLFISLLIFTFVFLEIAFISPLNKKNDSYSSDVKKLTTEKKKIMNTIRTKDELEEKLDEVIITYNKKLVLFPKTEKQAKVLKDYADFSNASGTSINAINFNSSIDSDANLLDDSSLLDESPVKEKKPKEDEGKDKIITNTINIDITGGFNNLMKFINYIQKDKRVMNISNVQLNKNTTNIVVGVNDIRAVITVQYYNLNYFEKEKYYFNNGHYGKKDYFN